MDYRRASRSGWVEGLRQQLQFMLRSPCLLCSRTTAQLFCPDCHHRFQACRSLQPISTVNDLPLYSWGRYEGVLKQSLAKLKYDHCRAVAKPLGQWLAQVWLETNPSIQKLVAVPIPLHRDRQQQRGYNQAELIAQSFCQMTGILLQPQGLTRTQATTAQYRLSRQARYQNLSSAFSLGSALEQQSRQSRIVLIDDIFTTGATLKSATAVLHQAGFSVAALLTVAISERHAA